VAQGPPDPHRPAARGAFGSTPAFFVRRIARIASGYWLALAVALGRLVALPRRWGRCVGPR
jgi:peptidoglycan/LPS O-acetylase OafA/YrhL